MKGELMKDHERRALARENCAIKRLLPLMYFPLLALWSTIIECSKRELRGRHGLRDTVIKLP